MKLGVKVTYEEANYLIMMIGNQEPCHVINLVFDRDGYVM